MIFIEKRGNKIDSEQNPRILPIRSACIGRYVAPTKEPTETIWRATIYTE